MTPFLQEIQDLPWTLRGMVDFYRSQGRPLLSSWRERALRSRHLLFTGMGTSEFAPQAVFGLLARAGLSAQTVDAGEWLHYGAAIREETLPVLLSQSGESAEIVRLIEERHVEPGYVALTNSLESSLARSAGLVLPLQAGEEASISTKTYTNTLAVLYLMGSILEGERTLLRAADDLAAVSRRLLDSDPAEVRDAAEFLLPADALCFVGRGPAHVAARQCALTYMEGARCVARAFTGGAFRHGPLESCGPDLRLVVFLPEGRTRGLLESLAREAAELGTHVVLITDAECDPAGNLRVIRVPRFPGEASEDLFPITVSGVHALLLHEVARRRGIQAGEFRYGSKITSRE